MASRGWATKLTLADLENFLINEEDLDKSTLSRPTNGEETALFTNRRSNQGYDYGHGRGRDRGRGYGHGIGRF